MTAYLIVGRDFGEPSLNDSALFGYNIGDTIDLVDADLAAYLLDAGLIVPVAPTVSSTLTFVDKTSDFAVAAADAGGRYNVSSASAVTATVPANATDAIPVGSTFEIVRRGAGVVAVTPANGVTLNSAYGYRNLARQFSAAALVKLAADEWDLQGDLA